MTNYSNVYEFKTNQTKGFTATLTFSDPATSQPLYNNAAAATMTLTRVADNFMEFNWTTANNKITLLNNASLSINVEPDALVPGQWIYANEKYPLQNYTFRLEVFNNANNSIVAITGSFTIYQF